MRRPSASFHNMAARHSGVSGRSGTSSFWMKGGSEVEDTADMLRR